MQLQSLYTCDGLNLLPVHAVSLVHLLVIQTSKNNKNNKDQFDNDIFNTVLAFQLKVNRYGECR